MIRRTSFNPQLELDDLWKALFHTFPSDPKPPVSIEYKEEDKNKIRIDIAVAGFHDEDIKVFSKDGVLCVEGDNRDRDNVPERLRYKFVRSFPTKGNIDLSKTEVSLRYGILTITLSISDPEENKTFFFGK